MDIRLRQQLLEQAKSGKVPAGVGLPDPRQRDVTKTLLRVGVGGYSPSTANYQDVYIDGNDSDGEIPLPTGLLKCDNYQNLYDEGRNTWNRQRGNYSEVIIPLAQSAVAVQRTLVMDNFNARGGHFVVNVSAVAGGVVLTPTIYGYDPINAISYPILNDPTAAPFTINAAGVFVFKVYPGIGQVANRAASDVLPRFFYFSMGQTVGGGVSATYSVTLNWVI